MGSVPAQEFAASRKDDRYRVLAISRNMVRECMMLRLIELYVFGYRGGV